MLVLRAGDEDDYVDIEGESGIIGFDQHQLYAEGQVYRAENENSGQFTEYHQTDEGEEYVQYRQQGEGGEYYDPTAYSGEFQGQDGFEGMLH